MSKKSNLDQMTSWDKNRGIIATLSILREMLRQKGLHNRDLAIRLGVTERTVTRWINGKSLELEVLQDLCELAGISLNELFELSGRMQDREPVNLSRDMELKLVDEPAMLVALATLQSHSPEEAKQLTGMSECEWITALIGLDKLGLIQLLPKNHVRLLVPRTFQWLKDGPVRRMQHRWFKEIFGELVLNEEDLTSRYSTLTLSARSVAIIEERYRALMTEMDQLSAADRQFTSESERRWFGVLLSVRPLSVSPFSHWRRRSPAEQLKRSAAAAYACREAEELPDQPRAKASTSALAGFR